MSRKNRRSTNVSAAKRPAPARNRHRLLIAKAVAGGLLVATVLGWPFRQSALEAIGGTRASAASASIPQTLLALLDLPSERLARCDIALMNLLCAVGLK